MYNKKTQKNLDTSIEVFVIESSLKQIQEDLL
jgi:hypothetical protein